VYTKYKGVDIMAIKPKEKITIETNLKKWGNSDAIRLPKELTKITKFKPNEKLEVTAIGDSIVIKKIHHKYKHKTLKQRLKEFDGDLSDYEYKEWDSGEPVGDEVC